MEITVNMTITIDLAKQALGLTQCEVLVLGSTLEYARPSVLTGSGMYDFAGLASGLEYEGRCCT